jgi:uncharacterized protein YmfQ (DUF2313 family)
VSSCRDVVFEENAKWNWSVQSDGVEKMEFQVLDDNVPEVTAWNANNVQRGQAVKDQLLGAAGGGAGTYFQGASSSNGGVPDLLQ